MASLKESFLVPTPAQTKATPQSRDLCPKSILPGSAATTRQANPSADKGNPLGVGSLGDGRKPFKLSGG